MGHSFVEVGERGVWVNDAILTLIRHFVEREGGKLLDEMAAGLVLRQSFQVFLEGFSDYGPGVFVVDFRPLLEGEAGQLDFLLSVFDRVAQVLRAFGGSIPFTYLERHINNTANICYTGDVETRAILDGLRRVWGLFSGLE
jgi:hypothetical protein